MTGGFSPELRPGTPSANEEEMLSRLDGASELLQKWKLDLKEQEQTMKIETRECMGASDEEQTSTSDSEDYGSEDDGGMAFNEENS